jgi:hypothetical protein
MTAYKIDASAYLYHYDNGFTGPDAMGWDPNLQFAWSRAAAAKTCGVPFSPDKVLAALITRFGHDRLTHNLIGTDFHHLQSQAIAGFCTPARQTEIEKLMPAIEGGAFPQRH